MDELLVVESSSTTNTVTEPSELIITESNDVTIIEVSPTSEIIIADPQTTAIIEVVSVEVLAPENTSEILIISETLSSGHISSFDFIEIVWTSPTVESGNIIELTGTCYNLNGVLITGYELSIELLVSDNSGVYEPSDTAVFTLPTSPIGTLLGGTGTARSIWKTNSSGVVKIAILDTSPGNRFLWTKAGGHMQKYIKAKDGIQEIIFT